MQDEHQKDPTTITHPPCNLPIPQEGRTVRQSTAAWVLIGLLE